METLPKVNCVNTTNMREEILKKLSEKYAIKAYSATGVNPNLIEQVVFEALTDMDKAVRSAYPEDSLSEAMSELRQVLINTEKSMENLRLTIELTKAKRGIL